LVHAVETNRSDLYRIIGLAGGHPASIDQTAVDVSVPAMI